MKDLTNDQDERLFTAVEAEQVMQKIQPWKRGGVVIVDLDHLRGDETLEHGQSRRLTQKRVQKTVESFKASPLAAMSNVWLLEDGGV